MMMFPFGKSLFIVLAKGPPPAAFCSPFGIGRHKSCRKLLKIWDRQTDTNMGQSDRHTQIYGTDRQTDTHTYGTDIQTDSKTVFMLKTFLFAV